MQFSNLLQLVRQDHLSADVLELCPEGPKFSLLGVVESLVELLGTGRALEAIGEDLCVVPKLG